MTISGYTAVDLSQIPAPSIVEELSFDAIFQEMLSDLQDRDAVFLDLLPSDPAYKILEVAAYRELLIRQRINEAARAVMLAYATGSDLDQIAANFNVVRLVIDPGDEDAVPPVLPTLESDEELRRRAQLAFEALSVAGPASAYIHHSLSAHADVKDIGISSPGPGEVLVSVLSREGNGTAEEAILDAVEGVLSDDVRPLTDNVTVQSATIVEYEIEAELTVFPGPDSDVVLENATQSIQAYIDASHRIGRDITLSGVYAALHVAGVQNVTLISPEEDIEIDGNEAPYCTDVDVSVVGVDE